MLYHPRAHVSGKADDRGPRLTVRSSRIGAGHHKLAHGSSVTSTVLADGTSASAIATHLAHCRRDGRGGRLSDGGAQQSVAAAPTVEVLPEVGSERPHRCFGMGADSIAGRGAASPDSSGLAHPAWGPCR
jgi:hypothetical protein